MSAGAAELVPVTPGPMVESPRGRHSRAALTREARQRPGRAAGAVRIVGPRTSAARTAGSCDTARATRSYGCERTTQNFTRLVEATRPAASRVETSSMYVPGVSRLRLRPIWTVPAALARAVAPRLAVVVPVLPLWVALPTRT